jgi:dTDP-4-dehydrorhamnose 3,5-epimerase
MDIIEGSIKGLLFLKMEMHVDERGFFARNFCKESITNAGGYSQVNQANISFNKVKGTIRGFHFQTEGHEESKTVTVYKGSLHYKVIDLRKDSPTYLKQDSFILRELEDMVQVPKGCAPAFQTLEDNVLLQYYVSNSYSSSHESGVRFNDPFFNFKWPLIPTVISGRDRNFPDFDPESFSGLKS